MEAQREGVEDTDELALGSGSRNVRGPSGAQVGVAAGRPAASAARQQVAVVPVRVE